MVVFIFKNRLSELVGDLLVGIDAENPVVGGEAVGEVFLFGIAQPVLVDELHAVVGADFLGVVGGA